MTFTRLPEDEIAEFLINTERKESKITENILLDGYYLLFKEYVQEKKLVFISGIILYERTSTWMNYKGI